VLWEVRAGLAALGLHTHSGRIGCSEGNFDNPERPRRLFERLEGICWAKHAEIVLG
jgi:hypothetical protein